MNTERRKVNDLLVTLDRYGDGPPLVLLHGWPEWRAVWEKLAPLLADGGYTVIAPDLRNFGETTTPEHATPLIDPEILAADLASLLDELGYRSAGLVAHDVGAFVAQTFARRWPERASALFFFDCPHSLIGQRWADADHISAVWYQYFHQLPLSEQLAGASRPAVRTYLKHFLDHWAGRPGLFDSVLERWSDIYLRRGRLADGFGWYRGTLDMRLRQLRHGAIPHPIIKAPTMVLWGERDPVNSAAWLDALPEIFADLRVATLKGVGHFPHWEAPEEAARAIRSHFGRHLKHDGSARQSMKLPPKPAQTAYPRDYPRQILADALWVPVLTHFTGDKENLKLDSARLRQQLSWLGQFTRHFMVSGSTGEGWALSDETFEQLLRIWADPQVSDGTHLIIACLGKTTEDVVRRAEIVERVALDHPAFNQRIEALAVCPPVDPDASQLAILAHYTTVFARSHRPIAVYQLPQVTGCEIAAHTVKALLDRGRPIPFIKDSSGRDALARSGLRLRPAALLRGAEDSYAESLFPEGEYDGWLLSTGNVFAPELQQIAAAIRKNALSEAQSLSRHLEQAVTSMFSEAGKLGVASPFAAVNKALDHLRAYGQTWPSQPLPMLSSGETLPRPLFEKAQEVLSSLNILTKTGYTSAEYQPQPTA